MTTLLRWTSSDLEYFPDDGKRREIIDGELYVSKQPDWYHQVISGRLSGFLETWSMQHDIGMAAIAPGLILAEDDDVVPDVVWASHARLAQILRGGKLYGAPELVIEVLSPGKRNMHRDRETKLKLYARHGVDEYWIVDWMRHTLDIYRSSGELLVLFMTFKSGDQVTSPLLPGFMLTLDQLFANVPRSIEMDEESNGDMTC